MSKLEYIPDLEIEEPQEKTPEYEIPESQEGLFYCLQKIHECRGSLKFFLTMQIYHFLNYITGEPWTQYDKIFEDSKDQDFHTKDQDFHTKDNLYREDVSDRILRSPLSLGLFIIWSQEKVINTVQRSKCHFKFCLDSDNHEVVILYNDTRNPIKDEWGDVEFQSKIFRYGWDNGIKDYIDCMVKIYAYIEGIVATPFLNNYQIRHLEFHTTTFFSTQVRHHFGGFGVRKYKQTLTSIMTLLTEDKRVRSHKLDALDTLHVIYNEYTFGWFLMMQQMYLTKTIFLTYREKVFTCQFGENPKALGPGYSLVIKYYEGGISKKTEQYFFKRFAKTEEYLKKFKKVLKTLKN